MRPDRLIFLVALVLLLTIPAFAANDLQAGKELFSTQLGSNGKSCSSCHPDGKGLEHADDYQGEQLRGIINACIRDALKGQLLPDDDPRLVELESYVRSLKQ
jgi:cytochrome c553